MPNFRGCQPFLAIVQSPDGSTYQFVIPAYSYVGPRKSQTHLQVMAEEYLEEQRARKAQASAATKAQATIRGKQARAEVKGKVQAADA